MELKLGFLILCTSAILCLFFTVRKLRRNDPKPSQTNYVLMTMITTFKDSSDRNDIQNNTIRNWALFLPRIQPVLMSTSPRGLLSRWSRQYGWKMYPVSKMNEYNTPQLKTMFHEVMKLTRNQNTFYGFCNGDILFDEGLLHTLDVIQEHLENLTSPLVIGRRTNLDMSKVMNRANFYHWSNVSKARGSLFRIDAIDYFFIADAHAFIWDKLKDVVIGRPGYDNYLVAMAIYHNVSVIDATQTIKAVHQTGLDGVLAGQRNKDKDYNKRLIGTFNYNHGLTTLAPYVTLRDKDHGIVLRKRK